jgi:predicted MPP superfamily phosphohydrolase
MRLSRRSFFKYSLASAGIAGLYAWRIEPHWVEFVHRQLPIKGLPHDLEGRTLVQLSDLHIGPRVDDDYLRETFERVAQLRPDFVVMTGDFVSYRDAAQFGQMSGVIAAFPHGRLATLAILGNHDYGHAWSELAVADHVVGVATHAGIDVLRNETRVVAGLQFVGLDDYWSPRFAPAPVMAARDRADVPVRNKRYTAGPFALSGGRTLYINRGLGHLLPVRFNVRPEVTVFELARA